METELDKIPGLERALARIKRLEENYRETAFLPVGEEIAGLSVAQLTLRRMSHLMAIKSPFLTGGNQRPEDVAQFLWIVWPTYNQRGLGKGDFIREIAHLPYGRTCRQIERYLDRAFLDLPASKSKGSSTGLTTSFVAIMVDWFAKAYGWREDEILDKPVARLFQYLRLIRMRENPDVPQVSKLRDRVKQRVLTRYVAKLNKSGGAANE